MHRISRRLVSAIALLTVLAFAAPALAQTGGIRGKLTDEKGAPVEGAVVKLEGKNTARKAEIKTNKKGEFIQIGLFPGEYKLSVERGGNVVFTSDTRITFGDPTVFDISLKPVAGQPNAAQVERDTKLRGLFDAGVASVQAANYDDAIAKFTEASTMLPTCHVCYYNIGAAYAKKAEAAGQAPEAADLWTKTEENYKKSVELKPDYTDGWSALAALYNQQKKFDLAAQASEKAVGGAAGATGGGNAPALYNQGVIFWNQNKYQEAKDKFEAATQADPKYSEAWYRLGMAWMNLGDMAKAVTAFEGYLTADPNGSHAAEVKGAIDALKPKQ
jgi:tetratricopeptide (TPR) repeat protein